MFDKYNEKRVVSLDQSGKKLLPFFAWQLDNTKDISEDELRISVKWIRLEPASFESMAAESGYDKTVMSRNIMNILHQRGKLHNPATDTGGSLFGAIDEIGKNLADRRFAIGEEVVIMLSAAMIPLHLDEVIDINFDLDFIRVKGYCIVDSLHILLKKPDDIGALALLSAMEESGSLYRVSQISRSYQTFIIIAANPMIAYLYAFSIRKSVGKDGRVHGLLFGHMCDKRYEKAMLRVFDKVFYHDSEDFFNLKNPAMRERENAFDLTVNCADMKQTELLSLFLTREYGTIFLSNISKHYSAVTLLSEKLRKDVNVQCGVGYVEGFQHYNLELLKECNKEINEIIHISKTITSLEKDTQNKSILNAGNKVVTNHFIYESHAMEKLMTEIAKAAKYDGPVLIKGETGTGKEKIMELIYANSKRNAGPCIRVNCASVPATLWESEFFGYERGAFTGAQVNGKAGYFELADQGILFLDEIGDMPMELQAKFLRVLQEKQYFRIGGQRPIRTNFRIIAASNKDLKEMMEENLFREDLYYRVAVLMLEIPPLRERKEDIIPLAEYFMGQYIRTYQCEIKAENGAFGVLLQYDWPGNIRELENLLQRAIVNSEGAYLTASGILQELNREIPSDGKQMEEWGFKEYMDSQEKELIRTALERYKTTRNAAAALNMCQSQFMRKKKKHNL